ncbi:MAG: NAD(P)/FAD-dependent oxidoreductase, partial [Bryobacteraceae bacterium]
MKTYDVVIVGGGIIGCSIALALSRRKLHVAVLDRQQMLQEASWAAAGMLSPAPDCTAAIPLVPLARASLALYGQFVADLEDVSRLQTSYRRNGTLEALFLGDPERELSTLVALHHGLGLACEPLPIEEALKMEPSLGLGMRAAALLPDESSIDVRALGAALLATVKISGADLFPGTAAASWIMDGNCCRGIKTAAGEIFSSAEVILAAGCWTNQIGEAKPFAPVNPVRGQMVS